ncbi:hypothetical protein J4460_06740 [Candidatus Woesearchaeota archaeon]|nr:MAG: hypothetical protein QS99_C0017G0020 [archaeon GW2011_AR4]MBS3130337.1 hypothetical protein [Candidatus Woesearchaeota archaeon]
MDSENDGGFGSRDGPRGDRPRSGGFRGGGKPRSGGFSSGGGRPRSGGGFSSGGGRPRGGFGPREMHKTTCSECGQECEVPFKPTEGRPVFCKDCYAKRKASGE